MYANISGAAKNSFDSIQCLCEEEVRWLIVVSQTEEVKTFRICPLSICCDIIVFILIHIYQNKLMEKSGYILYLSVYPKPEISLCHRSPPSKNTPVSHTVTMDIKAATSDYFHC